jgi:hypothetical protein
MRILPPKRIGRVVGMGQTDTIPTTDVLQSGDIGTPTINANSVPEGSTGQVSTGSGTLNAITPTAGGDVLQLSPITVYGTVPTTGGGGAGAPQPSAPATAMASMTILGMPWWVVLAAVGVASVFAFLETRGPRRTGTRRRKKGKRRATHRRAASRRRGRRRNPARKRKRAARRRGPTKAQRAARRRETARLEKHYNSAAYRATHSEY